MQVVERNNNVTLSVNLDNWESVGKALEYIRANSSAYCNASNVIQTNKVKVIKMVRAYGIQVKEGKADAGLKSAKEFVEGRMTDLIYRLT